MEMESLEPIKTKKNKGFRVFYILFHYPVYIFPHLLE